MRRRRPGGSFPKKIAARQVRRRASQLLDALLVIRKLPCDVGGQGRGQLVFELFGVLLDQAVLPGSPLGRLGKKRRDGAGGQLALP